MASRWSARNRCHGRPSLGRMVRARTWAASCVAGSEDGSRNRVLHPYPQHSHGDCWRWACALHRWVRSIGLWVGMCGTLNSCSFPVIVIAALSYVDKRQEHTDTLMIRQFGKIYDRSRSPPLPRVASQRSEPKSSANAPTGSSRTSRSITRSCPLCGAVSLMCAHPCSFAAGCMKSFGLSTRRSDWSHRCLGRSSAASDHRSSGELAAASGSRPISCRFRAMSRAKRGSKL